MKKLIIRLFTVQLLIYVMVTSAYAQADSAAKAKQLIAIEQSLCDALPRDTALWSSYLDPNWYAITEDGTGFYKQEFLKGFGPFPKGVSGNIRVTHPVCLFRDSIAIVHYVADENESVYGQKLHTTYAAMDTWYRTSKSWMMLSMQIFEVPQLPVAIKSSAAALKMFTGEYEMTESKTATVSLRHDTLFIQKNNHDPVALYQETENVFFIMSDTRGRKIFVKDGSGKMTMLERRNGQDLVWRMKSVAN